MEASFVQTPSGLDAWGHDIVFEFAGDDDFWLYVDDELILDLGGTHSALMGKVNFRTGVVTYDDSKAHSDNMKTKTLREIFAENYRKRNPNASEAEVNEYLTQNFSDGETVFSDYSTHKMKVFYMERGGNASNLYMRFNLAAVTPGHVVMAKSLKGEGAEDLDTDFMEYPFQIYYTLPDGENGAPGDPRTENLPMSGRKKQSIPDKLRLTYHNHGPLFPDPHDRQSPVCSGRRFAAGAGFGAQPETQSLSKDTLPKMVILRGFALQKTSVSIVH